MGKLNLSGHVKQKRGKKVEINLGTSTQVKNQKKGAGSIWIFSGVKTFAK